MRFYRINWILENRIPMVEEYYATLAAYVLDYIALALIIIFGIRLIYLGQKKDNVVAKQYCMSLGLFFNAVAGSALLYMVDLTGETFFDGRVFPRNTDYQAMGYTFDSMHHQFYMIIILAFVLLAISFLMKPIELQMMQKPKARISQICLALTPLPFIIRILEITTLPLENSPLYYVYSAGFIVCWLFIGISVMIMLSLYIKIAKTPGQVGKRAISIIVALLIWLVLIFTRSQFMKSIVANIPYLFWLLPTLEICMFLLFVNGFSDTMEYDSKTDGEHYQYQNWFFKLSIIAIFAFFAIYGSILAWNEDLAMVTYWSTQTNVSEQLNLYAEFMDRSLFEGDGFGGQDIVYVLLVPVVLLYLISFIPKLAPKLQPLRKYTGYIIFCTLALMVINRGFKAFYGRVRPSEAMADPTLFTRIFEIGKYSLSKGFSKGSFTSGHTTTAVCIVAFAFLMIKTHKTWKITLSFLLTIGFTIAMAFGRIAEGAHYPGDTLWAAIIGILVELWAYFYLFKIPEQEQGKVDFQHQFVALRGSFTFAFLCVFILAIPLGIKYTILEFEFYWPIVSVVGILGTLFMIKRMKKAFAMKELKATAAI